MQEQKMVNNFTYSFGDFGDIIDNYDRDKSNFIVKKIPSNNIHYTKYLIKYKKDSLDNDNIEMLSLYRSIIVFKDNTTNKFSLKSFSAPKSLNYNSFIEKNNFDSCFITEIVDGTMVNMFYDLYSEEWVVCTKSNYGANCKFNLDIDLTFKEMFEECFKNDNLNYDMFNKKYSYSFILQHPKNRIVTPVRNPTLYLIGVYKCEDNKALLLLDTEEYNIMKTPENFNYDEFIAKYPRGSKEYGKATKGCGWFESIGTLYKQGLFNGELLFDWLTVKLPWSRLSGFAMGVRDAAEEPRLYENFEAMAKE